MFSKKITSMLLASSMIVAMQAGPVYAGDMASDINFLKYTAEAGTESGEGLLDAITESIPTDEADEADLEEGRVAAKAAADAAEYAAGEARGYADETESAEVETAAENAALDADNARAAADLASGANDSRTVAMAVEIAEAAQAEAEAALADAAEAKAAEEKAKEEEMLASAEYLGNFTLTAYCNCARCCGTAGNATASGVMPTSNHTVAMGGIDFGTKLLINGTVYTVEDRGTPYGHVDIFMDSHSEALQFGMGSADVYLIRE